MKSSIAKLSVAAFGLSLAVAPLSASAAQWGIGVNVKGPGYSVHAGYVNPGGPCYGCGRAAGWHPAPRVVLYDGYYGWAPGGFNGYYWHGGWYAHRRWGNGFWIYF